MAVVVVVFLVGLRRFLLERSLSLLALVALQTLAPEPMARVRQATIRPLIHLLRLVADSAAAALLLTLTAATAVVVVAVTEPDLPEHLLAVLELSAKAIMAATDLTTPPFLTIRPQVAVAAPAQLGNLHPPPLVVMAATAFLLPSLARPSLMAAAVVAASAPLPELRVMAGREAVVLAGDWRPERMEPPILAVAAAAAVALLTTPTVAVTAAPASSSSGIPWRPRNGPVC